MKRDRATELLEGLLRRVSEGAGWPLEVVESVRVFGSYARGALEPGDVDVAVDLNRQHTRWGPHVAKSIISQGRNPYSIVSQALCGQKRGVSILFEREHGHEDVPMMLLWTRGESVEVALERLRAIPADAAAGRAPRDAMLPCFEGLEEWLPLFVREELIDLIDSHILSVDQVELAEAEVEDPWISSEIGKRWGSQSPLRRAAHATLANLKARGVDLYTVHLHGRDIKDRITPYFVGFQLRYLKMALTCFKDHSGLEWLEVVHPTRRGPLLALRLRPSERFDLYDEHGHGRSLFN
jgi:hypothetical protein